MSSKSLDLTNKVAEDPHVVLIGDNEWSKVKAKAFKVGRVTRFCAKI